MDKIKCPNCGFEFELSQTLFSELENELKDKLKEKTKALEISSAAEKKKLKEELLNEKQEFINGVEKDTTKRLQEEFDLKAKLSQDQLTTINDKYLQSQQKIQKLLVETANSRQIIEEERVRLLEENNKVKKELEIKIQTKVDEEHRLKTLERDKVIEDQKKKLLEMQRKLETGSSQLVGEVLELDIETRLQSIYPLDKVKEVLKGIAGADVKQTVMNNFSQECGLILIETKNTKEFAKKWINKLRDDNYCFTNGCKVFYNTRRYNYL